MEARVLTEIDANAYRAMRLQSVKEHPKWADPEMLRELAVFATRTTGLLSAYALEDTRVWGVFDDFSLAGVAVITRRSASKRPKRLALWGVYVRPSYRGTLTSRLLMAAVIAWCEQQSSEFRLCTQFPRANIHARQLFDRYGFTEILGQAGSPTATSSAQALVAMERER